MCYAGFVAKEDSRASSARHIPDFYISVAAASSDSSTAESNGRDWIRVSGEGIQTLSLEHAPHLTRVIVVTRHDDVFVSGQTPIAAPRSPKRRLTDTGFNVPDAQSGVRRTRNDGLGICEN